MNFVAREVHNPWKDPSGKYVHSRLKDKCPLGLLKQRSKPFIYVIDLSMLNL